MKKLLKLRKELAYNKQLSLEVYKVLLDNKDTFIKQAAATDCLLYNHIYESESKKILTFIKNNGNRMASMAAKRILLISEGRIDPNDPF